MRFNDSADFYSIRFYDASAATYTARSVSGADDLFSDTFDVGDWVEFTGNLDSGTQDTRFNDITSLNIDVALAASAVTGVWEVYSSLTGSGNYAWRTLTVTDNTNGFTITGDHSILFDPYNFAECGTNFRTIRYRLTAVTSPTQGGHYSAKPQKGDYILYIESGDTKTLAEIRTASVAGGWNCIQTFDDANSTDSYRLNCGIKVETGGTLNIRQNNLELWSNSVGRPHVLMWGTGAVNIGNINGTKGTYQGSRVTQRTWATDHKVDFSGCSACTIYGSVLGYGNGLNDGSWVIGTSTTMVNSTMEGFQCNIVDAPTITRATLYASSLMQFDPSATTTYEQVLSSSAGAGIYSIREYDTKQLIFDRFEGAVSNNRESNWVMLDSPDSDALDWSGKFTTNGKVYIKWRCNIKVVDTNGMAISGVTVLCKKTGGTTEFTTTTAADGTITEQWITSKYHLLSGSYSQTNYNPFSFTISKAGYRTIQIQNITLSEPIDWVLELSAGDTVIYDSTIYDSVIY